MHVVVQAEPERLLLIEVDRFLPLRRTLHLRQAHVGDAGAKLRKPLADVRAERLRARGRPAIGADEAGLPLVGRNLDALPPIPPSRTQPRRRTGVRNLYHLSATVPTPPSTVPAAPK